MHINELFEIANLRKSSTGLPVNIYVSSGGSVNQQHGPIIKVMTSSGDKFDVRNTVSIMLKRNITQDDVIGYDILPANVLSKVREYINLNYNTLILYWNDEIDTIELGKRLKPIKQE